MALHPQKVGYGVSIGGHVLLVVAGLIGFLTSPQRFDEGEAVPVEIVSDEPAQSVRGDLRGERMPTPQRVVDRQAAEERTTPDPATLPVARERVQNVQLPPPPAPRPPEIAEEPPPQPTRLAAVQPQPTMPVPPQPLPRPTQPAATEEVREDPAAREAEIQARQRREEEQRRQEEQRQAEQRRREEQRRLEERRQAEQRQREQRERELREARERQERERAERDRQLREARERAERQRQERANARQFDPNSIAARLNQTQENDRRQAARTEATGATAPSRTASLGTATGAASRITGREIDAIRAWAERCWEVPIAAREGAAAAVRLRVSFNPDGTVTGRPEVQNPRGDSTFQILANSAVRAVMRCSAEGGVRLPRERYETWREVVLNFDPRDMMR